MLYARLMMIFFFGVYVKLKKVIASSPENFTSRKSRHYILLNRNKISE